MTREEILDRIVEERERQLRLAFDGDTEAFDKSNGRNDWVAHIIAYLGRATDCHRNARENKSFRDSLFKAGALILAALEAHEKHYRAYNREKS